VPEGWLVPLLHLAQCLPKTAKEPQNIDSPAFTAFTLTASQWQGAFSQKLKVDFLHESLPWMAASHVKKKRFQKI